MAESDTILQLGIEAAREGNREEARNLFSLLTRQEPDNVQAWLWYAGVADGQDERRAALERVVELDPNNEMARRGLQAMGVSPTVTARAEAPAFVEPQPAEPVYADAEPDVPVVAAAPAFDADRELTEDEQLAAELDMAYEDYDTVEREGPAFRNEPTPLRDESLEEAAVGAGAGGRLGSRRGSRRFNADDDADPYARNDSGARSRPMGLLIGLVLVILLLLCVILAWPRFFGGANNVAVVNDNNNAVVGVATPGGENLNANGGVTNTNGVTGTTGLTGTEPLSGTGTLTNTPPLTSTEPLTTTPPVTGIAPLTTTQPVAPTPAPPGSQATAVPAQPTPAPPPAGDLASANPQPVPTSQQITAGDWSYTFPNFCLGSCATSAGNQIGGFTAQGTYVVALVLVSNNSGTAQAIPANFFVLKDAQGRIHTAQPQVSSAYLIRGVNADISMEDTIQPGGASTSVPLVFDVPRDATNLVLFSSANPNQGFQILNAVQ